MRFLGPVVILSSLLLMGLGLAQCSPGSQAEERVGRYALVSMGLAVDGRPRVVKLDTQTGRVWELITVETGDKSVEVWSELGTEWAEEQVGKTVAVEVEEEEEGK